MTTFKVTGKNSIFTDETGFYQDSPAADSLTVDIDAFIISTRTSAIELQNTGGWTATINGTVMSTSSGDGIELSNGAATSSKITIGAFGSVSGVNGISLGSAASLTNKGVIDGDAYGVLVSGAKTTTITNSGAIAGDAAGIRISGVGPVKITNSATGFIDGILDTAAVAAMTITNSGKITGTLLLPSILTNSVSNSGNISTLEFGEGKNVLTNSGSITEVNFGSNGTDIVTNSGKMSLNAFDTIELKGGNDIFKNTSLTPIKVDMGAGDDLFTGGNGVETVIDASGSDKVALGGDDDIYYALAIIDDGTDTIDGGSGSDLYDASGAGVGVNINLDTVAHNFAPITPGLTLVASSAQQGAVKDNIKNFEYVRGSNFNDNIAGSAASNSLDGGDGADVLFGYSGNDLLRGGTGSDQLFGGAGADSLNGGSGSDVYFIEKVTDSPVTGRDRITSFENTLDLISFQAIDANTKNGSATNDAFVYIGANVSFTGVAGQLRSYWTESGHILEGDVNGDGKADVAVEVSDPTHAIDWIQDFIL